MRSAIRLTDINEEDMPFLIALVIAIDNIVDKKRKN